MDAMKKKERKKESSKEIRYIQRGLILNDMQHPRRAPGKLPVK
jgi:hypothetical protein